MHSGAYADDEDAHPERRGDAYTRHIVRLTVQEMLDSVGIDLVTSEGRHRFRNNMTFLDDARTGTGTAKKTIFGLLLTGFAYGIWKAFLVLAPVLVK